MPPPEEPAPGQFAPTRWTLVSRAQGESPQARAALSELCEAYYEPVYRFICREGRSEDEGRELTQDFFSRILASGSLNPDRDQGRFRSYLLGAVKHFLADQRKHAARKKRGGEAAMVSLDDEEGSISPEEAMAFSPGQPDTWFDRQWALNIMARGLKSVESDFQKRGKEDQFPILKHWLGTGEAPFSQSEAAGKLGQSESALRVSIYRIRTRFRESIRKEIAQTVSEESSVDEELRYLVEVLARHS